MMYNNKLIVAIKSNGKVLREQGDTVFLPFGQEFTILVKNKNSLRCLVKIEIDGTDATENTSLIVPANGEIELERYIKNRNLTSGNRFKFIERTASIENGPRGIKVDDGLVRVEFEFEREPVPIKSVQISSPWINPYDDRRYFLGAMSQEINTSSIQGSILRSHVNNEAPRAMFSASAQSANAGQETYSFNSIGTEKGSKVDTLPSAHVNLNGITVPGSVSDQKFALGEWFATDGVKHVMIMKLLGETSEGKTVVEAVTVKSKPKCVTCGHTNKANAKFCSNCGTSLTIV